MLTVSRTLKDHLNSNDVLFFSREITLDRIRKSEIGGVNVFGYHNVGI